MGVKLKDAVLGISLVLCKLLIVNSISVYSFYVQDYYVNWGNMCCFLYDRLYWWVLILVTTWKSFVGAMHADDWFGKVVWGFIMFYSRCQSYLSFSYFTNYKKCDLPRDFCWITLNLHGVLVWFGCTNQSNKNLFLLGVVGYMDPQTKAAGKCYRYLY